MLAFYLCLRQVFTAACSSPTTSALRTCWQPWTTVRNLCRRSTSRPSCTLSVDTSVTSGNMDVQSPPGLLRLFPSERLRKMSNQMMGLLSHYNLGKRTGLYGGKVTWSTECFLVCETPPICHPCSQGLLCWSCGYLWSWANQKVTCSGVVACFGGIQVIQGPRIPSVSPSVAAKMWGLSRAPQDHTGVTAFQSKNYFLLYVFLLHLRSLIEFPELHLSESLICLTG